MMEKKHAALQSKHESSVAKHVARHAKKMAVGKAAKDGQSSMK